MTLAAALARGRRRTESVTFTDTGLIQRKTGQTMDPVTLVLVDTYTTIYTGPCRVQGRGLVGQTPEAGGTAHVVAATELQIPASSTAVVEPGDVLTVTASAHNAGLVGRPMRLGAEAPLKSHGTKRVFAIAEVQA